MRSAGQPGVLLKVEAAVGRGERARAVFAGPAHGGWDLVALRHLPSNAARKTRPASFGQPATSRTGRRLLSQSKGDKVALHTLGAFSTLLCRLEYDPKVEKSGKRSGRESTSRG